MRGQCGGKEQSHCLFPSSHPAMLLLKSIVLSSLISPCLLYHHHHFHLTTMITLSVCHPRGVCEQHPVSSTPPSMGPLSRPPQNSPGRLWPLLPNFRPGSEQLQDLKRKKSWIMRRELRCWCAGLRVTREGDGKGRRSSCRAELGPTWRPRYAPL